MVWFSNAFSFYFSFGVRNANDGTAHMGATLWATNPFGLLCIHEGSASVASRVLQIAFSVRIDRVWS